MYDLPARLRELIASYERQGLYDVSTDTIRDMLDAAAVPVDDYPLIPSAADRWLNQGPREGGAS